AEDIVQDAFAALHGRWHVQSDADAALAYLRWSVVHRSRSVPPLRPAEGTGEPASGTGGPGSAGLSGPRAPSPPPPGGGGPRFLAGLARGDARRGDRHEHGRRARPRRPGTVVAAGRAGVSDS